MTEKEFYSVAFVVLVVAALAMVGGLIYAQSNGFNEGFEFTSDPAAFLGILTLAILFSLVFLAITYERDPEC